MSTKNSNLNEFFYQVKSERPGFSSGITETESEKSAVEATEQALQNLNGGGIVTILKRKKNEQD